MRGGGRANNSVPNLLSIVSCTVSPSSLSPFTLMLFKRGRRKGAGRFLILGGGQ